ncbi:ribosome maturation factor RimM [Duganella sp. BJB488]|uniref:Ribosome maturation factor RimM n=1 Tax=Duganella vulcania TaxID=2692166 RepID=A0A845HRS3_9BURK|nr:MULTISPECIES: ribosome maturation factor RimM [Duganella]MYN19554.1 ribosome maturation factor RimM [Duganella vulcania]RFP09767.1 ribosome maturation factor RimM [Duganella sp. BJB489]RFP13372.1 ribosome maturation factor RimM [Duganella sp. BJB488]RFP29334.1 ribosome maturation factor RimM [Duganella sp. BJB480]
MTDKNASGVQVPDDLAQVGFVFGAYGVAGWVRIRPFSEDADALLAVKTWWIDKPGLHDVDVKQCKLHGGDVVAQLVGVTDRNVAEALKGAAVSIPRSRFPALSDDEFYWAELIGLDVENLQGEHLGTVTDMMSNGPQSILRIQPAPTPDADPEVAAQERLIPFVDAFIIKVDKAAKKITVDWGLDY